MMGGGSTRNMYSVIEMTKLRRMTSCWLYIMNISADARAYECQIIFRTVACLSLTTNPVIQWNTNSDWISNVTVFL
jgi:hypothetical protein